MSETKASQYIPQAAPFVMIDEVTRADDSVSETTFTVRDGHLFVENGRFTEPGLVENMAQTAAAGTGYKAQQSGKPAPVGYIGALKNLVIHELPKTGDTLTTEIRFIHQVMNAHIVQGKIMKDEREIANCELKIFLQQ
jgi:predicted hotdog family 3-hydroxylacyl-ACP dehydratase